VKASAASTEVKKAPPHGSQGEAWAASSRCYPDQARKGISPVDTAYHGRHGGREAYFVRHRKAPHRGGTGLILGEPCSWELLSARCGSKRRNTAAGGKVPRKGPAGEGGASWSIMKRCGIDTPHICNLANARTVPLDSERGRHRHPRPSASSGPGVKRHWTKGQLERAGIVR